MSEYNRDFAKLNGGRTDQLSQSMDRGFGERLVIEATDTSARPQAKRSKKYGNRFGTGFLEFYQQGELTDVTVVAPDGMEYKLHMVLLAFHSAFFRRAFGAEFVEKAARRITLGFEDAASVWPTLVQYFYTDEIVLSDENVLALFAMSRELMVPRIQEYCADFAQNSLESSNAIQYLNQAVQFNCDTFRQSCVSLVSEGFPNSFNKPTDGLPVEVILEILQHPQLAVQTEEQVLVFVLNYVTRHILETQITTELFSHVKFPFLSNDRLAQLAAQDAIPKDMLLKAMATRLQLIDHPEKMHQPHMCAPRKTYICSLDYGLPGGSEYAAIPMEAIWDELASQLQVRVSGDTVEGDPDSILRTVDDSTWFTVIGEDGSRPAWVEIAFPTNMRVVEFSKYTFSHGMNFASHMFPYGISDSTWFQMKGLCSQVSTAEGELFSTLRTSESNAAQTEYTVTVDPAQSKLVTWQRLRISTGPDKSGDTVRLSIRKLKLYGRVEVSLTQENSGKDILGAWKRKKERKFPNRSKSVNGFY